jgi:hypothetical protein
MSKNLTLHPSTFEYLKPTDEQVEQMARVRAAAKECADVIDLYVPDGPEKDAVIHDLRTCLMWCNVAITRHPDGSPRE